jgi:hypothetical protein
MNASDEFYNVAIDKSTVMLIDAYADRSVFRPSRRQAVRALIRQALRAHGIPAARTAAPAPAAASQQGEVR